MKEFILETSALSAFVKDIFLCLGMSFFSKYILVAGSTFSLFYEDKFVKKNNLFFTF